VPVITRATQTLDGLAIPYRLFTHASPPASLQEAARERGQDPSQVVRSILFRHSGDSFVLVLMAGPGQIFWKRVRTHLGITRLSLADEAEVRRVTGCEIGTVNPFSLPAGTRILADANVFAPLEISIGSGLRGTAIILETTHLRQALPGVEVADLAAV
jgi:prolyl-tRNA editing enzyme YbaK/EbsC (Cys-tRNA(Pro) deacylase)